MFQKGSAHETCNLAGAESSTQDQFHVFRFSTGFTEHFGHLIAELPAMFRRVEPQQTLIYGEHRSVLPRHAQSCQSRQLLHAVDLKLQSTTALGRQPVSLTPAGSLALFEAFDPFVIE